MATSNARSSSTSSGRSFSIRTIITPELGQSAPDWIDFRTVASVVLLCCSYGLERMFFHSFAEAAQIFFPKADIELKAFRMLAEFLPLVGAWFGENMIGEFRSSLVGLVLEVAGGCVFLAGLPADSPPSHQLLPLTTNQGSMYTALILMALGICLTRTNAMVLAARQIPESRIRDTSFFLLFYWIMNLGSFLGRCMEGTYNSLIVVVMWPIPLFVSILTLVVARYVSPTFERDEPSLRVWHIALSSIDRSKRKPGPARLGEEEPLMNSTDDRELHLMTLGKHLKSLFVIIAIQIVFNAVYAVEESWIVDMQADWELEESALNYDFKWLVRSVNSIAAIVIAPVTHFVVLPCLRRCWPAILNQLRMIGIGMVLCAVACFVGAVWDFFRTDRIESPADQIFHQIPQFVVLELAEIFTYVVGYEFIYLETPKGLKNFVLGLYLSSQGLGVGLSYLLEYAYYKAANGPVKESLAVFLMCLAAVQLLALIPFVVFAVSYKYRKDYERDVDTALKDEPSFGGD